MLRMNIDLADEYVSTQSLKRSQDDLRSHEVRVGAPTQEAGHLLARLCHVHLQDKVGVRAEAEQRGFMSTEMHQLLQDAGVVLQTHISHQALQTACRLHDC